MPLSVPRFGNLAQYFCKQPLALGHESGKHRPSECVVSPFYKISKVSEPRRCHCLVLRVLAPGQYSYQPQ